MKRPSPAEIAEDRRWRIKAWVLTTLAPDTIAAILARSMPPTISELLTLARRGPTSRWKKTDTMPIYPFLRTATTNTRTLKSLRIDFARRLSASVCPTGKF